MGSSSDSNSNGPEMSMSLDDGGLFMLMWIIFMVAFMMCPFIGTKYRRQLCWKRLSTCSWAVEGMATNANQQRIAERQARQRELRERFQLSKTQQDEIREQYLVSEMEPYSMVLKESDIHKMDDDDDASASSSPHGGLRSFFKRSNSHNNKHNHNNNCNNSVRSGRSWGSFGRRNSGASQSAQPDTEGHKQQQHKPSMDNSGSQTMTDTSSDSGDEERNQQQGNADIENQVTIDTGVHTDTIVTLSDDGEAGPNRKRFESADSIEMMSLPDDDDDSLFDTDETLWIPLAGQQLSEEATPDKSNENTTDLVSFNLRTATRRRNVPNNCAICIAELEVDDIVTWSSNPKCSHIFHQSCVLHWLLAVGRKTAKKRRVVDLDKICDFPKDCPCCRQEFIVTEIVEVNKEQTTTTTASTTEEEQQQDVADEQTTPPQEEV